MSEALLLEFEATAAQYEAVNKALGIDGKTGEGDWPAGLESHTGATGDGKLVVFETWDALSSFESFMGSRLGAAIGQAGISQPTRVEWLTVVGHKAG